MHQIPECDENHLEREWLTPQCFLSRNDYSPEGSWRKEEKRTRFYSPETSRHSD